MKKLLLLMAGGVVVLGLVYLNSRFRGGPQKLNWRVVPAAPTQVEAQKPARRPITHLVSAPGTLHPLVEVQISSQVVGRILKLPVKEGDTVKKGDVLARLDALDYEARVHSAEARVERLKAAIRQADADLEKAERDDKRYNDLIANGAASVDERANAHTTLLRLQAARDMAFQESIEAQGSLEAAQEDLRRTVITAPVDGIVAQILTEEGEVLIPGTMNLPGAVFMVISDLDKMEVKTQIDESDVALVRPGQRAWIYLTTDDRTALPGVVQRVTPKGVKQAEVTTFETRILVESADPRLRSGMTANVEIEVRRHENALAVPIQAVRHRKRKDLPPEVLAETPTETPIATSAATSTASLSPDAPSATTSPSGAPSTASSSPGAPSTTSSPPGAPSSTSSQPGESSGTSAPPDAPSGAASSPAASSAPSPATRPAAFPRRRRGQDLDAEYLKVVFVIQDGKARARLVRTDISDESFVEITAGIGPDDQVITGPYRVLDVLKDGQPVEPSATPATMPAAPSLTAAP
jgi:HlyD family secretion protein